jgi:hypothetical protein
MSKINEDNGSQQWFDATMRSRIQEKITTKQHGNQRSNSYLDQRVNTQPQQPAEISDPYIKKLVESRQQQPFYSPAHLGSAGLDRSRGGDYEINLDMDSFQKAIQKKQNELGIPSQIPDADLSQIFGKHPTTPQLPGIRQPNDQPSGQVVTLLEGYPVYRPIHQEHGNQTIVLAREIGVINAQLASQQFIPRNNVRVYVIPQHQTQVNIQEIQNNPNLLTSLVELQTPPMSSLGTLLVAREAINGGNMGYVGGRQLITDHRQHQVQQQPVTSQARQYGVPFRRGILKG